MSEDEWTVTGKTWGTNSLPFEVHNQNNLRGVAKPGAGIVPDRVLRAANEKIASDLAFILNLPVPPVTLWDRGVACDVERYVSISAWAFYPAIEWPLAREHLSERQKILAGEAASAMAVFDTWICAQDRRNDHVLIWDNGDPDNLSLAYIDYAFSLSYDWSHPEPKSGKPKLAFPTELPKSTEAIHNTIDRIEALTDAEINQIVSRVPSSCASIVAQEAVSKGLIERRDTLRLNFKSAGV